MPFTLSEVVPWGRSYDEYVAMFALSPADLQRTILGCGDGPASFNATLSVRNGTVISVDPIYALSPDEIRRRIDETAPAVLEQTRRNRDEFVWETIPSIGALGRIRMAAMTAFLADFARGAAAGRYRTGSLPRLEFRDRQFDLALCSHLLFLYSEQLSAEFHLASIRELCRVAREVRIFPLLELGAKRSRHLPAVCAGLAADGYRLAITEVAYQFQKGGNEMLVVALGDE